MNESVIAKKGKRKKDSFQESFFVVQLVTGKVAVLACCAKVERRGPTS
jgi:hypothetical protein